MPCRETKITDRVKLRARRDLRIVQLADDFDTVFELVTRMPRLQNERDLSWSSAEPTVERIHRATPRIMVAFAIVLYTAR
jgi:hypothetical protein